MWHDKYTQLNEFGLPKLTKSAETFLNTLEQVINDSLVKKSKNLPKANDMDQDFIIKLVSYKPFSKSFDVELETLKILISETELNPVVLHRKKIIRWWNTWRVKNMQIAIHWYNVYR